MELTKDQKRFINENALQIKDLNKLTRECFNDDSLDGRTKQGRAVRKYLIENSINFKTTATCRTEDIVFTEQQKEFIF